MSGPIARAFDPSKLKPGDEVGVTWMSLDGQCEFTYRVESIEDDGMIRVEGQELPFWPDDGREVELIWDGVVMPSPNHTRLCEPTDEGRINSFRSNLGTQLDDLNDSLQEQIHNMSWEQLTGLQTAINALQAEFPPRAAIEVPVGDGDILAIPPRGEARGSS